MSLSSDADQIPSTCWECSTCCGSIMTVRDGRVTKVAPNPAHPGSKGAFCVKGVRGAVEWTYGESRLTHPLRRVGPRGSGEWERVSWDEALGGVAAGLASVRERHGPLAIAGAISGAYFSRGPVMALLMRSIGSPNTMINQDLCGGCRALSDRITGLGITGGEDIERANTVLIVGRNPYAADPVQWLALKRAKARGARIVVIDPFRTPAVDMADLWLRPTPNTDAAIALAMIGVVIEEGLYDRGFVAEWCHGFEPLAERVRSYTPEVAAAISGVPAEAIVEAARLYAAGPSTFVSGHGIDAFSAGVQTFRAFHSLLAITGNLARPGGNLRPKRPPGFRTYLDLLHDPAFRLPEATERQTIGADRFPLWAGPEGWQMACHNSSVIEAMLTGEPYPVRALYASGVNIAVTYPDTTRTLEALRSLDVFAVAAQTMTPTAALADYVLPKTTTLEEEEVSFHASGACLTYTAPAPARVGEVRTDLEIAAGLLDHMRAHGAMSAELLPWRTQPELNAFLMRDCAIALEDLRRDGFAPVPQEHGIFGPGSFRTPTGKVELYSETLARLGQDPLPDYVPVQSARGEGIRAAFPLTLQTGFREKTYHHSRFREQGWAQGFPGSDRLRPSRDGAELQRGRRRLGHGRDGRRLRAGAASRQPDGIDHARRPDDGHGLVGAEGGGPPFRGARRQRERRPELPGRLRPRQRLRGHPRPRLPPGPGKRGTGPRLTRNPYSPARPCLGAPAGWLFARRRCRAALGRGAALAHERA